MIFHEIYGSYFQTVSSILLDAQKGSLNRNRIYKIAYQKAFGESAIFISQAFAEGRWPLLNPDCSTPIRTSPRLPLTRIEKAWLKAILQDPRIRLFLPIEGEDGRSCSDSSFEIEDGKSFPDSSFEIENSKSFPGIDLSDVEPLFQQEDIIYYDQRTCGDPYEAREYQNVFRTILNALPLHEKLSVLCKGNVQNHSQTLIPLYLEYSQRTDTFRMIALTESIHQKAFPLSDITVCIRTGESISGDFLLSAIKQSAPVASSLTLLLNDWRNALERFLMEFSDLETETERISQDSYRISVSYRNEEEDEILMRILAFGPLVHITEPRAVVEKIKERLSGPLLS